MKVLQITPEAPGNKSGGQRGVLQSLLSLKGVNKKIEVIDFVGPRIFDETIKQLYRKTYELEPTKSIIKQILILLHGETNKRYYAWKNCKIDFTKYDLIFIDFTKMDYVIRDIRKLNKSIRIITRVHNVELDYANADYNNKKNIKKWFVKIFTKKQEKYISDNSDKLLFLSEKDYSRFNELYHVANNKKIIVPVCVNGPKEITNASKKIKNLLITGSLWFGSNAEGIFWLINNVLKKVKYPYNLTIAGSHPTEELKQICKMNKITLIDSPENMEPLFIDSDILLIPIFDGAGMKVKFAEGLSYGKVIISTTFGAVGYDIENERNCFIADAPNLFAEYITKCLIMSDKDFEQIKQIARSLYEEKYSIDACIKYYEDFL